MSERDELGAWALAPASQADGGAEAGVAYDSRGRLLILGSGERVTRAASALSEVLSCRLWTSAETVVPPGVSATLSRGRALHVDGHLGAFRARLAAPDGEREPDPGEASEPPDFDLVLDLGATPAIAREWGPPGYFRPRSEAGFVRALEALPRLTGRLAKPKFFALDPTICAHGLPGTEGCRRCLDACPADAIHAREGRIVVDANLCQGAGACATTCPTGALTYRYPARADTLRELAQRLAAAGQAGGAPPVVVFHGADDDASALAALPAGALAFRQHALAAAGMETWLAALALGAGAVRLLLAPEAAASITRTLDEQLTFARAVLEGLGLPPEVLGWLREGEELRDGARLPQPSPAASIEARTKRGVLFAALDHLQARVALTEEAFALPAGAPFGALDVDASACTTCLACATLCPTRALAGGGGAIPQLLFTEAACVQCGLCVAGCPEHALTRRARLLVSPAERTRARVLHQDEPFPCKACGRPFASMGTVRAVVAKLADHPHFRASGLELLELCYECRARVSAEPAPRAPGFD